MTEPDPAAVRREIAARRRAQVFQMRREGAPLDAIATRLSVSRSTVRRMVAREVSSMQAEMQPDERRMVHVDALMDLWRVLHGPAAQGDMAAIDRFLRVEERLSGLLGLDRCTDDPPETPPAAAQAPRFTRRAASVLADDVLAGGDEGA